MSLFLVFRLSQLILPIIFIPIYLNVLGEKTFADYITYAALTTLVSSIINLNLETVNLRRLSEKLYVEKIKYCCFLVYDRWYLYIASTTILVVILGLTDQPLYAILVIDPILFNSLYPNAVLMTFNKYSFVLASYLFCKLSFVLLILGIDSFELAISIHCSLTICFILILNRRFLAIMIKRYGACLKHRPTLDRISRNCRENYRLILQKLIQFNVICPKLIISFIAPASALIVFEISEKLYSASKLAPSALYQHLFARVEREISILKIILVALGYTCVTITAFAIMEITIENYFGYELDSTPYILFSGLFFSIIYLFQGKLNIVKYGSISGYQHTSLLSSILGLLILPSLVLIINDSYVVPIWIVLCEMFYCLMSLGAFYVRK